LSEKNICKPLQHNHAIDILLMAGFYIYLY